MAYQVTESKAVTADKNLCVIYIDTVADLAAIPETIRKNLAVGSAAYTASFEIFTLTGNGWVNDNGMDVII